MICGDAIAAFEGQLAMITGAEVSKGPQNVTVAKTGDSRIHKEGDFGNKIVNITMGDNCTLNFY